jgi:hypothetical protein
MHMSQVHGLEGQAYHRRTYRWHSEARIHTGALAIQRTNKYVMPCLALTVLAKAQLLE